MEISDKRSTLCLILILLNIFMLGKCRATIILDDYCQPTDSATYGHGSEGEKLACNWVKQYNIEIQKILHESCLVTWNQSTNMTAENQAKSDALNQKTSDIMMQYTQKAKSFDTTDFNFVLKRLFKILTTTTNSQDPMIRNELIRVQSDMAMLYGNAQACLPDGSCLPVGETGVADYFRTEKDYDLLLEVWKSWSLNSGKKIRPYYVDFVRLANLGAVENGYLDYGYAEWSTDFEDPLFTSIIVDLYNGLKPFYQQIHGYIRYKLNQQYPGRFDPFGLIPVHILGNMFGQNMVNLIDIAEPYPSISKVDITDTLVKMEKNNQLDAVGMFKIAEEFFVSIGLFPMTQKFWTNSMIVHPADNRIVQCHGSATSCSDTDDFRIQMCTEMTYEDFKTIHHEMGHVEYYMSYDKQLQPFKNSANSGFHEAVGDTIALSVTTTQHLKKINLLQDNDTSKKHEVSLNMLMFKALEKIAFIPFALSMDDWRWRVFNGSIDQSNYNKEWWNIRAKYQGVKPPIERTEEDFDPGSKYHIATNTAYIRYFVSYIVQFQFYKAMCDAKGWTGPLHECDFYESKEAGAKLKGMLELGSSKPWQEALYVLTGSRELSIASLLQYFEPFRIWLQDYNTKNNVVIGW